MNKKFLFISVFLVSGLIFMTIAAKKSSQQLSPIEQLGKKMFFDENLSIPVGQSCATCHGREAGWSGPDSLINKSTAVYPGAIKSRFGNRRPPTAAYGGWTPILHLDQSEEEPLFVGGLFWDGRATGWEIDDPLAEQAMGPFLNPLEQNVMDKKIVAQKVLKSDYAYLFKKVWGKDSLSLENYEKTFVKIAQSIAAYERSIELNPFSSKFDDFWRQAKRAGLDIEKIDEKNYTKFMNLGLNDEEVKGLMLFNTQGLCAECHVLTSINGNPPLFTDFTFDNLGVPKNPKNPFYKAGKEWNPDGANWVDKGLGAFLKTTKKYNKLAKENYGKHKVPTLRNLDKRPNPDFVKVFMHNGVFSSLKEVVDFYNTRDLPKKKWPEPEVKVNINKDELGNLKLTEAEVNAIVIFMKTLSDR